MVQEPRSGREWLSLTVRNIPQIIIHPIYIWFLVNRVVPFRWKRLSHEFIEDLFYYRGASLREKLWAYERGFCSEKIKRYGLTKDNYIEYISDIEFYRYSSFVSTRLSRWCDDKMTTYMILAPFADYLPIHYCWIRNGFVTPMSDKCNQHVDSVENLIRLLKNVKELAVKATFLSRGNGFYKLSYANGNYYANGNLISEKSLMVLISEISDSIVTEYVHCHTNLKKIYPKTPNACRLVIVNDPRLGPQLTSAQIRFGSKNTGYVDNSGKGDIVAGIRLEDGMMVNPIFLDGKGLKICNVHPDTTAAIEGMIPGWNQIVSVALKVSGYIHYIPYLSFDIVATDDDPKILEINAHGGQSTMQITFPFFKNPFVKKLFKKGASV